METLFDTLDANGLKSVADLIGMSHTDVLNLIRELNKADEGTKEVITGRFPVFYTLVRKQHDNDNATWNVIDYLYLYYSFV